MHKVAFLVERTDQRIDCLLNPESLVCRRIAGLRACSDATGAITGHGLTDDPLLPTGGGVTELDLDLLFDAAVMQDLRPDPTPSVAGPMEPLPDIDVRDRTRPLWALAENEPGATGYGAPPRVRLIWGQAWNIRGVVIAASERLERFTAGGVPQRSWLRLRLRRVAEEAPGDSASAAGKGRAPRLLDTPQAEIPVGPDGMPLLRLDQVAADRYGDPALWPFIAEANGVDDPLALPSGQVLILPASPPAATAA